MCSSCICAKEMFWFHSKFMVQIPTVCTINTQCDSTKSISNQDISQDLISTSVTTGKERSLRFNLDLR